MGLTDIEKLLEKQRHYFASQHTKSIPKRKQLLKALKKEIQRREQDICDALNNDFRKSEFESYLTEIGLILSELDYNISRIEAWSKPERVKASLLNFPSKDYIYKNPYGTVLIVAPWNYPFQLAIGPLIAAIAAGNTVVLKPSELTPHTSALIVKIIESVFEEDHVSAVEGGVETSQKLLSQRWDYIFFTGSVKVGKIVAKAAAEYMTPVTLELGGKSPCIIDETANIALTAKRIVWGKFLNAGQTCIAPDYILLKDEIKTNFIKCAIKEIEKAYSKTPKDSEDYPRIINERNFNRLANMLQSQSILFGGELDADELYISPTIVDNPSLDSDIMKEEIFGPILPILSYNSFDELTETIYNFEKPLSLYVFSKKKSFINKIIDTFSFGGGVVNDTLIHYGNKKLPFGGIGDSGIGNYHGKYGFKTFSHEKSIINKANWLDIPIRYAPYKGKLNLIKKAFKYLG